MRPQLHSVPADAGRRHGGYNSLWPCWLVSKLLEADAPLAEILPSIYKRHEARYMPAIPLRQLPEMRLYARHNVKQLQECSVNRISRKSV